ncbi:protein kinase [Sorangium sp. So ce375]|uniref:protein kinase domain-containing protein n=1 Tax=Sorangium sp. So ce375 TaxID=3133306 RepID=UPI003F5C1242
MQANTCAPLDNPCSMTADLPSRYLVAGQPMRGNMAVVQRVWDNAAQRLAALKLYGTHPLASAAAAREAAALTRVGGTVAPALYEAGHTATGRAYLLLELIDGHSLADHMKRGKSAALRVGMTAVAAAAEATAALLCQGIIHRDIAPANILVILPEGGPLEVRLIDFGCAHLTGKARSGTEYLPIDPPGLTLGTRAYLAPERLKGEIGGARSETFSLAAILFEILTGAPPPPDAFEIARALEKTRGLTAGLRAIVVRGLAPDTADRPAPAEFAASLRALLASARAPAWRSASPTLVAGTAVIAFAITCAAQKAVHAWIARRDAHACAFAAVGEEAAACARACKRDDADACAKGATLAGSAGDPEVVEMLGAACRLRDQRACVELWRSVSPLPAAARACAVGGDSASCLEAARLDLAAGRTAEAAKHLETGCARGKQDVCARLGEVLDEAEGASDADRRRAARLFEDACKTGVADACYHQGRALAESDPAFAEALLQKACDLGSAAACAWVGKALLRRHQPAAALPYLERACDAATGNFCGPLARLLVWGEDPKLRDPARGAALIDRACAGGKVGAACYWRGVMQIENGETKDAARSYGKGCARGDERSCEALATLVSKG